MEEGGHEGEGLFNFAFEQFEHHRKHNPEITKAIDEFCCGAGRNESAPVMFPVFYALKSFNETGGSIPSVSEQSAQKAREELREAGESVLDLPVFKDLRSAISHFVFFLNILVKSEETRKKAKLLFAVILRMIQVEKGNHPA